MPAQTHPTSNRTVGFTGDHQFGFPLDGIKRDGVLVGADQLGAVGATL